MQSAILIGIAGLFVTVGGAALHIAHKLGALEAKIDTMWDWWQAHVDVRIGGRRHTDVAADDGGDN